MLNNIRTKKKEKYKASINRAVKVFMLNLKTLLNKQGLNSFLETLELQKFQPFWQMIVRYFGKRLYVFTFFFRNIEKYQGYSSYTFLFKCKYTP